MGLLHEAATQLAFPHHLLLSKHFAVRSWNICFLLGAHSVGSVVTWLLFLVCRQGRHVKTGQLAAIKVMEVTEVKVPCKHSVCVSLLSVCSPLLSLIFCVFINLPLSWHSQLVHTSKYSRFILFLPFIFCFSVIFWGYSFKMSILQSINPDSGNYLLLFILKVIWLLFHRRQHEPKRFQAFSHSVYSVCKCIRFSVSGPQTNFSKRFGQCTALLKKMFQTGHLSRIIAASVKGWVLEGRKGAGASPVGPQMCVEMIEKFKNKRLEMICTFLHLQLKVSLNN